MKQAVLATVMAAALGVGVVAQGAATKALPLDNLGLEHLDIIVPDPAASARFYSRIIERRKLTQAEAADVLEVDQPKVSALRRGKLTGFSLDRLVRFLVLLGSDVDIIVKDQPRTRRRARLLVA